MENSRVYDILDYQWGGEKKNNNLRSCDILIFSKNG